MSEGSDRAFFISLDKSDKEQGAFYVQFNPKELKLDESAAWKASEEHEADKPLLTYEKGNPTTVSMELIFDSTDTGDNVNDKYIKELRGFLTGSIDDKKEDGKAVKRPPYCKFVWGEFEFECVIEKVAAQFIMFKPDGTPLRAKVGLTLKERSREVYSTSSGKAIQLYSQGSMFKGTADVKVVKAQPGDSASSVAAKTSTPLENVCNANGVEDPMAPFEPGTPVVLTNDPYLAEILGSQQQSHVATNYALDLKIDPFITDEEILDEDVFTLEPVVLADLANLFNTEDELVSNLDIYAEELAEHEQESLDAAAAVAAAEEAARQAALAEELANGLEPTEDTSEEAYAAYAAATAAAEAASQAAAAAAAIAAQAVVDAEVGSNTASGSGEFRELKAAVAKAIAAAMQAKSEATAAVKNAQMIKAQEEVRQAVLAAEAEPNLQADRLAAARAAQASLLAEAEAEAAANKAAMEAEQAATLASAQADEAEPNSQADKLAAARAAQAALLAEAEADAAANAAASQAAADAASADALADASASDERSVEKDALMAELEGSEQEAVAAAEEALAEKEAAEAEEAAAEAEAAAEESVEEAVEEEVEEEAIADASEEEAPKEELPETPPESKS
jgi:hypothetical protein